nr:MAG TPA: hypothetical protein [Caudoviricetes sp.]
MLTPLLRVCMSYSISTRAVDRSRRGDENPRIAIFL